MGVGGFEVELRGLAGGISGGGGGEEKGRIQGFCLRS